MSNPYQSPIHQLIFRFLPWVEGISLIAVAIALLLNYVGLPSAEIILVAGSLLAGLYFLLAFRPPETPPNENEKGDFKELLLLVMVPKITWIGCSVATIGLLFAYLDYMGWQNLLQIGTVALGAGSAAIFLGVVTGTKRINTVVPVLYRSVPILIIAVYLMMTRK